MRGMLLVVAGVCCVSLVYVLMAIPSSKQVEFPTTIAAHTMAPADFAPVSIKVSEAKAGQAAAIRLERGGQAARTSASDSREGFVAFRKPGRHAGSR